MKKRKKHINSCLLRLLGLFVSSGFVLLCLSFGLYLLTERPVVYEEDGQAMGVEHSSTMSHEAGEAISLPSQNVAAQTADESVQASVIVPEEKLEEKLEETPLETTMQQDTKENVPTEVVEATDETKDKTKDKTTGALQQTEEEEALEFEEVLVYDSYILQLDEGILDQIGDSFKNGQIDYAAVISEMFSSLSFADQIRLLNMVLSKVQTININEVWNMIQDGVSSEDSIKLQQLVQEHFTVEELDELYSYYASMEIVENEE